MRFEDWRPDFSVGVHSLDTDHKLLISLMRQLEGAFAVDDEQQYVTVLSILNALLDYTDYHFTREESMMAAVRFPGLVAHRAAHHAIIGNLLKVRDSFESDPAGTDRAMFQKFLIEAFHHHLVEIDKEYEPYMVARRDLAIIANEEFVNRDDDDGGLLFVDAD